MKNNKKKYEIKCLWLWNGKLIREQFNAIIYVLNNELTMNETRSVEDGELNI